MLETIDEAILFYGGKSSSVKNPSSQKPHGVNLYEIPSNDNDSTNM